MTTREEAIYRAINALEVFLTDPTIIKDDKAIEQGEAAVAALKEARRQPPTAKELADEMFRFLNVMGNSNIPELVEQLTWRQHRTIQQVLFRDLVVPLIKAWAEMEAGGFYDDRNEGTVKAARRLNNTLEAVPNPLPFI